MTDTADQHNYKLPSALEVVQTSLYGDPDHPMNSAIDTEWVSCLEDLDVFIADRDVLESLQASAPTGRLKDWLYGIIDYRKMQAAVTGIPF